MLKKIWKVVAIAVLLALLLVFVPSPLNTYDAFAEIVTLPIDQTGGLKYDPANYTSDTHYEDPSITVDIYWGGRIYDTNYVYAVIKIANASQLRTAFAFNYSSPGDGKRVADMAKKMNGVFAINGDYYSHSWHTNGYMVRQGKVYRNRPNKTWDLLMVDQYGNFHGMVEPNKEKVEAFLAQAEAEGLQVVNSWNFGPIIIQDGERTREDFNTLKQNLNTDYIGTYKDAQRIAFCQLDELTYLCVTSEGPEDKDSEGLTMNEFYDCLREVESKLDGYKIQTAFNLDGGSSCTFAFNNQKINAPTNPKKRSVPDCIYFASAWFSARLSRVLYHAIGVAAPDETAALRAAAAAILPDGSMRPGGCGGAGYEQPRPRAGRTILPFRYPVSGSHPVGAGVSRRAHLRYGLSVRGDHHHPAGAAAHGHGLPL